MFDFSSARAKLARAHIHIREAQEIYADFVKDNPYTIRNDVDDDGWHRIVVDTVKPWPPELALVLGDAASCLRGTLDHIAFACVTGSLGPKEEREIAFPIFDTEEQFKSKMGTLKKWLSPAALPLFEKFQPGPAPQHPSARFLAILREVNNRDKHRAVSLISGYVKRVMLTVSPSDGTVEFQTPDGRLEVGAVLSRLRLPQGVRREDVQTESVVTIIPIFGDGMPPITVGQSAVTALVMAHNFIDTEVFPAFNAVNGGHK